VADQEPLTVSDVMTAPAVSAIEDTDIVDLCRMMYKLRIHRVPIVREDKVLGIISSLDICNALATGRLTVSD
jgi:CBS domain-containing protein